MQISVTALDGKALYRLDNDRVSVPLAQPILPTANVTFIRGEPAPISGSVGSAAVGFALLDSVPPYEYGPSIVQENGIYTMFYCSPGHCGNLVFANTVSSSPTHHTHNL
eukprot:m.310010 g.310010  ORF g.310010 m.310010 type:complete len:109 (-) comp19646_c0_seq7:2925-3251(-)